jgi:D-amino peptidase
MRIAIMTDLEGVAGVIDSVNWCLWDSRYYEIAKELLTEEINAAVRGFKAAGASEFHVIDGHGYGGIDVRLLDPDVEYARGWPDDWPFGLDGSYDAIAFVGQHAKAGTEKAHLAHTGSMDMIDLSVNGVSIGEFGQFAYCAAELGVPAIFGSGDAAFTREAVDLVPGIETVCVKRGVASGAGEECTPDQYSKRNAGAVHIPPARARGLIQEGAKKAVERFRRGEIKLRRLDPPYECVMVFRADGDKPRREVRKTHPSSFIVLMNS